MTYSKRYGRTPLGGGIRITFLQITEIQVFEKMLFLLSFFGEANSILLYPSISFLPFFVTKTKQILKGVKFNICN